MNLRCTYIAKGTNDFTVGKEYEVIEEIPSIYVPGSSRYEIRNNYNCFTRVSLDNLKTQFEIVEKEEKEEMKENQTCVSGLQALKLMEANGTVFQQLYTSPVLYYKMMNGSLYRSDYPDKDWALNGTFNTNASFIPYVPKSSTGWHDTGKGMDFFWIDGIGFDDEKNCFEDEYPDDNRFSTKEKAEEINFKQTLFRKLQRFSDENGGLDIDWNDGSQTKWSIYYGYGFKTMVVDNCWKTREFGQVYFSSKEVAEEAVDLFRDDLIKYFTM